MASNQQSWTQAEKAYVLRNLDATNRTIAVQLGRSVRSISSFLWVNKVRRPQVSERKFK